MEAAATFLGVRPRSVQETRRRLIHHGYRADLVEGVLERLVEMGYLDDEGFARSWIESRDRSRPRGENALRRELSLKGIDRDTIVAVLAERSGSLTGSDDAEASLIEPVSVDRVVAERLLERRHAALMREVDPRKRQQRAYALLARNGFDPQVCQDVSARLVE